jgi:hypothetical protein
MPVIVMPTTNPPAHWLTVVQATGQVLPAWPAADRDPRGSGMYSSLLIIPGERRSTSGSALTR